MQSWKTCRNWHVKKGKLAIILLLRLKSSCMRWIRLCPSHRRSLIKPMRRKCSPRSWILTCHCHIDWSQSLITVRKLNQWCKKRWNLRMRLLRRHRKISKLYLILSKQNNNCNKTIKLAADKPKPTTKNTLFPHEEQTWEAHNTTLIILFGLFRTYTKITLGIKKGMKCNKLLWTEITG